MATATVGSRESPGSESLHLPHLTSHSVDDEKFFTRSWTSAEDNGNARRSLLAKGKWETGNNQPATAAVAVEVSIAIAEITRVFFHFHSSVLVAFLHELFELLQLTRKFFLSLNMKIKTPKIVSISRQRLSFLVFLVACGSVCLQVLELGLTFKHINAGIIGLHSLGGGVLKGGSILFVTPCGIRICCSFSN